VADTRYLKRRRQGWYFQLAVPSQHRETLGKATITASLGTRDLTVAQARRWPKLIETQEALAKVAHRRLPAAAVLEPQALLELDEIARAIYHQTLAELEADAQRGVRAWREPKDARNPNAHEIEGLMERVGEAFNSYCGWDFRSVAEPLLNFCTDKGLVPGSEPYRTVGEVLLGARMRALGGRARALQGKSSDKPTTFLEYEPIDPVTLKPLRAVGTKRGGLIFAEVAARFIAEKQRDPAFALTAQTKGQYEAAFRLFDQWAKQPRLGDIDRGKASAFIDTISSFNPRWGRGPGVKALSFDEIVERFGGHKPGLSAKTVNRYAMALGMVWKYAEDRDDYQGGNPWTRQSRPTTRRRGSSETDKRAFTQEEIRKLLEHRPSVAPATEAPAVLPWLTLIGAYSGMRLNEICELEIEDVKEVGGIWHFNLTASKTDAGIRVVPLHSKIIEIGFLQYRNGLNKGSLWPGLKPGGPDGKRSWYVSKRFTDYRRSLGLIDIDNVTKRDRLDFHSLRRSAITALKHADIQEHEVAEIVGHEHPRVTFGVYPGRQRLERLKVVVEAIRYGEEQS
jgi:integrase